MEKKRYGFNKKLSRLQWLMQKNHMRSHSKKGPLADMTRGQGRILAILKMQDEIATKDLSYLLGIRVSSLNELLAKMEKGEYITREPSSEDKRVLLVKLTEKGRAEEQQEIAPTNVFDCLNEEEKEKFTEYLDKVIAAFEEKLGEEMNEDEKEFWSQEGRRRMGDEKFEHFARMRYSGFDPRYAQMGYTCGKAHHHMHSRKHGKHQRDHSDKHGIREGCANMHEEVDENTSEDLN